MRRPLLTAVLSLILFSFVIPVHESEARRVVVRRAGRPGHRRTVVVVHKGWPLRRRMPEVVIHTRPGVVWKVATPRLFLAPVVWTAVVVSLPAEKERLVWEDRETLDADDDWTEFTLNCDGSGNALYLEVVGKVELNFAEVFFGNGDAQVVDFNEKAYKSGIYSLLDFKDGRHVDHVRMVGRSKDGESKVVLRLLK